MPPARFRINTRSAFAVGPGAARATRRSIGRNASPRAPVSPYVIRSRRLGGLRFITCSLVGRELGGIEEAPAQPARGDVGAAARACGDARLHLVDERGHLAVARRAVPHAFDQR